MNYTEIEISEVTINELEELESIGRNTFAESFADDNTPQDMSEYLQVNFNTDRLKKEIENPGSEFYFARLKDEVIGYLKINFDDAQSELKDPDGAEIERIYVLRQYHGKKVGQLLYEFALGRIRNRELRYVWLGVWEKNPRAIRFYKKNGFVEFDRHVFVLGNDRQMDIMMRLDL